MGHKTQNVEPNRDSFLIQRLLLKLGDTDEDLIEEISAVARTPDGSLWVASDQLRSLGRLLPQSGGVYGDRERYGLGDLVGLDGSGDEVDVEGLDFADGYLWFTGSHSLTRRDGDEHDSDAERIEALRALERKANHFVLGRVPIVEGRPVRTADVEGDERSAAAIRSSDDGGGIVGALADDAHLGPALGIPSKENGLDIEGLAVRGDRVHLGLRGPVLGSWAVILELRVEDAGHGILGLAEAESGQKYHKHFVDLAGLGVRELCWSNDDMLVLAGPTMDHEGAMNVYRLDIAALAGRDTVTPVGDGLELLFELPIAVGGDHAEGMALMTAFEEDGLVIVYDDPKPERRTGPSGVYADVFRI